jgi:alpha-methylacyl-CoA racemase
VLAFGEVAEHPHVRARNTVIEVNGVTQAAPAPRFSRTPAGPPTAPPVPGADTDAVLNDWGIEPVQPAG